MIYAVKVYRVKPEVARMVILEREDEKSGWTVREIMEGEMCDFVANAFGAAVDLMAVDGPVELMNDNVDLGRAVRWDSRMKKIFKAVAEEELVL